MNKLFYRNPAISLAATFLLCGLFVFAFAQQVSADPSCSITVSAPTAGAVWSGTQSIVWTANNNCGDKFDISWKEGGSWHNIIHDLGQSQTGGSYSWNTTSELYSNNYKVKVCRHNHSECGESGVFTIDNKTSTTTTVNCVSNPTTYGSSTSCTATVTRGSGTNAISGTVSWTSGGSGGFSSTSCTLAGSDSTKTCSVIYTPSAVGTSPHVITATYSGNTNFQTSTGNQSVTVNKASVNPSVTASNKTYDGTATASTVCSLTGVIGADVVTCSSSSANFSDKHVGDGKTVTASGITLGGADAGKYQLSVTTATATANISALEITVTSATNTKTYDGTTDASTKPTITVGSLQTGDTANFIETYSDKNVGTNKTLTPSGSISDGNEGKNYAITFAPADVGEITKKTITANITVDDKVYDGTKVAVISGVTPVGIIEGDDVSGVGGAAEFNNANVGENKPVNASGITLGGADAGNYSYGGTASATADITKKGVTATAHGTSKTYDGGTNAASAVTLSIDIFEGDKVTAAFGSAEFSDPDVGVAKPVAVKGIYISGAEAGNYELLNTEAETTANIVVNHGTVTIDPTTLTATYDGTPKSVTASAVDQDSNPISVTIDITYNGSATAPTNAGSYPVVASINDTNYAGSASATLNISKAEQTITFDALADKVYGDDFELSATSSSGLAVSFIASGYCTISGTTAHLTGAGSCTITAQQVGDDNYSAATDVSQTFNITARPITVTADEQTKVYGDDDPVLTYKIIEGSLVGEDELKGTMERDLGENVGDYAIKQGTLNLNENYILTFNPGKLLITKATLKVTASDQTKTYGDADPVFTVAYTGFIGEDSALSLAAEPTATVSVDHKNVGTYEITVSGGEDENYAFEYVPGTLTVSKRAITVTSATNTKTYDGTTSSSATPTITEGSLAEGDTATWSQTFDTAAAGSNKILTATGTVSDGNEGNNYTVTFVTATGTITAQESNGGGGSGGGSGGGAGVILSTEPALSIFDISSGGVSTTSLTLVWSTNLPSSSYVVYSAEGEAHELNTNDNGGNPPLFGYAHATPEYDTNPKVTAHKVTVTGLNPLVKYYFRMISRGSLAISSEYTTTTPAVASAQTVAETTGGETTTNAGTTTPTVVLQGTAGTNEPGAGTESAATPPAGPIIEEVPGTQSVS